MTEDPDTRGAAIISATVNGLPAHWPQLAVAHHTEPHAPTHRPEPGWAPLQGPPAPRPDSGAARRVSGGVPGHRGEAMCLRSPLAWGDRVVAALLASERKHYPGNAA